MRSILLVLISIAFLAPLSEAPPVKASAGSATERKALRFVAEATRRVKQNISEQRTLHKGEWRVLRRFCGIRWRSDGVETLTDNRKHHEEMQLLYNPRKRTITYREYEPDRRTIRGIHPNRWHVYNDKKTGLSVKASDTSL